MQHTTRRRRPYLVEVAPQKRERVSRLLSDLGVGETCRQLRMGRTVLLAIAATGRCSPGSAALLDVSLASPESSSSSAGAGR